MHQEEELHGESNSLVLDNTPNHMSINKKKNERI